MKPSEPASLQAGLRQLFDLIVANDEIAVEQQLEAYPVLAGLARVDGATRGEATDYFYQAIRHYVYAGDTALHVAAAAFRPGIAKDLIARGGDIAARNRRGAQPLHYACDTNLANPADQARIITLLLQAGADANARDKSGVAPLHRAVRTRGAAAVETLLAGGADPHLRNASGATSLHLAVQTTGRGGTGSEEAQAEQARIIALLLKYGARANDRDAKGKRVLDYVRSERLLQLLQAQQ